MTPAQACAQAAKGELQPIYLVVGEERLLRDEVVAALRSSALGGGVAAFNEDKFTAGEGSADRIFSAARTVPMMAPKRFVLVRGAERWDAGSDDDGDDDGGKKHAESPLDKLAQYIDSPIDSTCFVLVATKLDGRRKAFALAKKKNLIVACESLADRELPGWVAARAKEKGNPISRDTAELLAQIGGPSLSYLSDALERLSLYVGAGSAITTEAVGECITRVRLDDTWALVDHVGKRDLGAALRTLADVYDPRDRGLPLLGALAWSVRQLLRFKAEIGGGASPFEAAKRAGAFQPQRAQELETRTRTMNEKQLEKWMLVLAETDLALKGSKRPADAILEDMLCRLCGK
jgi:DNA polymerase-3 subunit delta